MAFQLASILCFLFLTSVSAVQVDQLTPRSLELSSECQAESTELLASSLERLIAAFANATTVIDSPESYDDICTLKTVNSTVTADCDYAKLIKSSVSVDPSLNDYRTECQTIGGKIVEMDSTMSSCKFSYTIQDIPMCIGMSCDPDEFIAHLQEQSNQIEGAFDFLSDLFNTNLFCPTSYELSYTGVIDDFSDDDSAGIAGYSSGYGQMIALFMGITISSLFMMG